MQSANTQLCNQRKEMFMMCRANSATAPRPFAYRGDHKKVIFLDIDGVLNADNGGPAIEERFVKRLAHIVERTGAFIVMSSSWRRAYKDHIDPNHAYRNDDVDLLIQLLDQYHLKISDSTPEISSGPYARPMEIRAWLQDAEELERFVILDDDTFWAWNWLGDYFVCTKRRRDDGSYEYGLTDEDAERAIEILNRPLAKYKSAR